MNDRLLKSASPRETSSFKGLFIAVFQNRKSDRFPVPIRRSPARLPEIVFGPSGTLLHDTGHTDNPGSIPRSRSRMRPRGNLGGFICARSARQESISKLTSPPKSAFLPAPSRIRKKAPIADAFSLKSDLPTVSADRPLVQSTDSEIRVGITHGIQGIRWFDYSTRGTARISRRPAT